jgi:hypothetical protein
MARQVLGSILVALAIVIVTNAIVTAKLGPNAEGDHGGGGKTQQEDHSGKGGG